MTIVRKSLFVCMCIGFVLGLAGVASAASRPVVGSTSVAVDGFGHGTLSATVNPEGLATTYVFEVGPTTTYGMNFPAHGASAGAGTTANTVSATVFRLEPEATYHVRISASNSAGTTYGADKTFTTPGALSVLEKTIRLPEGAVPVEAIDSPYKYTYLDASRNKFGTVEQSSGVDTVHTFAQTTPITAIAGESELDFLAKSGETFGKIKLDGTGEQSWSFPYGRATSLTVEENGSESVAWFTAAGKRAFFRRSNTGNWLEYPVGTISGELEDIQAEWGAVRATTNGCASSGKCQLVQLNDETGKITITTLPARARSFVYDHYTNVVYATVDQPSSKLLRCGAEKGGTCSEIALPAGSEPSRNKMYLTGNRPWFIEEGVPALGAYDPASSTVSAFPLPANSQPKALEGRGVYPVVFEAGQIQVFGNPRPDTMAPTVELSGPLTKGLEPGVNAYFLHVHATDGSAELGPVGSGVRTITVSVNGTVVASKEQECSTIPASCPLDLEWVFESNKFPANPRVSVNVTDQAGNHAESSIDLQPPVLTLSGSAVKAVEEGQMTGSYELHISATDGSPTAPQSGVVAANVSVDGTVVQTYSQSCPEGSCGLEKTWTYEPARYTGSPHTVVIEVADRVGNATGQELSPNSGAEEPSVPYQFNEAEQLEAEKETEEEEARNGPFEYGPEAIAEGTKGHSAGATPMASPRPVEGQCLTSPNEPHHSHHAAQEGKNELYANGFVWCGSAGGTGTIQIFVYKKGPLGNYGLFAHSAPENWGPSVVYKKYFVGIPRGIPCKPGMYYAKTKVVFGHPFQGYEGWNKPFTAAQRRPIEVTCKE